MADVVIILTRPRAQSLATLARFPPELRDAARIIVSPVLETVASGPLPDLGHSAGLIFSSGAAVRAFLALGGQFQRPVFTVGQSTAQVARAAGLLAQPRGATAEALVDSLLAAPPPAPLMHLHGTFTRGAIAQRLTDGGLPTSGACIYDQPARPMEQTALEALAGSVPVVVPLYSPRSAALFVAGVTPIAPLYLVCMSPAVARAAETLNAQDISIAPEPTSKAMTATMRSLVDRLRLGKC